MFDIYLNQIKNAKSDDEIKRVLAQVGMDATYSSKVQKECSEYAGYYDNFIV